MAAHPGTHRADHGAAAPAGRAPCAGPEPGAIRLELGAALGGPPAPRRYRLCGVAVRTDRPLAALAAFEERGAAAAGAKRPAPRPGAGAGRVATRGLIAGRERRVAVTGAAGRLTVDIEDAGRFTLDPGARRIVLARACPGARPAELAECALGVPLALALAGRGCWLLHAASVLTPQGLIAIAGDSGSGKSTLAARLDRAPGLRRLGDDLLGVRRAGGGLQALPAFPQLKLPPDRQPELAAAPLAAVLVLRPGAEALAVRPLARRRRLLPWLRHVVAARALPAGLLEAHLRFCAAAAAIPMFEVDYPHRPEALEHLAGWLAAGKISVTAPGHPCAGRAVAASSTSGHGGPPAAPTPE